MALNIITKPVDEMKQTLTLDRQTVVKVCDDVLAAMINGLPEEVPLQYHLVRCVSR